MSQAFSKFKAAIFDRSAIHSCVRWYVMCNLSLRHRKEMLAERPHEFGSRHLPHGKLVTRYDNRHLMRKRLRVRGNGA